MINHLVPTEFYMGQNYPNPFKDKTTIKYCVADKTRVQITVYDSEGNEIEKLVDKVKEPGTYEVEFSICHSRKSAIGGENLPAANQGLPDAYYYYRMTAGDYLSEKKWLCINKLSGRFGMKTLLQSLFFLLLVTQLCFAQWVQLGLDDKGIKDIVARNSNIFAVTSDSAVYRSTDNGNNWAQIVDSGALDIAIAQSGTVFMVKDSLVYSSLNNGDTWIRLNVVDLFPPPYSLYYGPKNVAVSPVGILFCGFIVIAPKGGAQTAIAISTDEGSSWTTPGCIWDTTAVIGGNLFDFRGQSVISTGWTIVGCGSGSYIYSSSDNGQTWLGKAYPPIAYDNTLGLCLNGNIICGGGLSWAGDGIHLSTDTGGSWTQVSELHPETGLSLASGGMLIGTNSLGVFLFSDNGDSLGSFNQGLSNPNAHTFTIDNNNYVYAGTENGIWRRPLSEITSVEEKEIDVVPTEFLLSLNYPNPFNPSTKIKYSVPNQTKVIIKVYDVLGNEIETLVNEEKPAGTYELNWDAATLPSGVYFYQLQAGDYLNTKKMILIK